MLPGELPDEPRVHRPEQHLAALGALLQAGLRVQQPAQLRAGEVGRQRQAAAFAEAVLADVAAELAHELVGARVGPVDRVVHRLAGLALPQHRRLALVGDAERDEVGAVELRLVERVLHDLADVAPDLVGVVLDPARARIELVVLLLGDGDDARRAIEDQAARGRRPLVDRRDVVLLHHHRGDCLPRDRPELARDRARGLAHERHQLAARLARDAAAARAGPKMATAPTVTPRRSMIGAAHETWPTTSSPTSAAQPRSRTRASSRWRRSGSVIVQVGERLQARSSMQLAGRVGMVGEQDLAQRGRVRRQQRADVERLHAVVRAEDVVDDEDLALVQRADPNRLVRARGQRVRPVQRARAQLVAVEVARAHVQQRGAELVLAALLVLLDEARRAAACATNRARCPSAARARRRGRPRRAGACDPTAAAGSRRRARSTGCSGATRLLTQSYGVRRS